MSNIRFRAYEITLSRKPVEVEIPKQRTSEYYGEMVFSMEVMRHFLPREVFLTMKNIVEKGGKLDRLVADQVAAAMKSWALAKGATHYTHWFQPLTGSTAEKHDSFFNLGDDGKAIEQFTAYQLAQQEPDASSFPSGGIRNTFEARGYTAWDPSSPAFIIGNTLCIPTIFFSYTGESLDYKTPLIKALHLLDKSATEVCGLFDKSVNSVIATLGIEQEYFLIDSALYRVRPDLMLAGRTLCGHASARDQQLEDNYFGAIPERILAFMKELEIESYRLGIPLKTRHNEVAPNQFECAPMFEEANIAIDHNQLLMDLIERIAKKHNFTAVLHEKPFAGVNGSGKHNNWSLQTNTGINLLSPGKTSKSNLRFLSFLVNVVKAVHDHDDLLRACIASAGNDLRLGGNEAPPAIISVFIGSQLTRTLDEIEKQGRRKIKAANGSSHDLNIPKIPEILFDNTDRNRTSPFAFTGNKFEFRAVGSSANSATSMVALNTIVADQLRQFVEDVNGMAGKTKGKDAAIIEVLRRYISESSKIRFEGNNYSEEWKAEAEKRGLKNVNNTVDALDAYTTAKTIGLFERNGVLTGREIHARHEIRLENYVKKIQIESRMMGDLAINHIIPVVTRYQNMLIENVKGLKEILTSKEYSQAAAPALMTIREISDHCALIKLWVAEMIEERRLANLILEMNERARAYQQNVLRYFVLIRERIDKLELLVDDELWPLPKYRELLFTK
ncbi:MAG: glutamine synthetase III [Bacteroidetes bacterium]|nr:glutamine synthetase III [Bacteroidota bacterium]